MEKEQEKELIEVLKGLTERFTPRPYPVYEPLDVLDNDEVCKVLHCSLRALDTYVSKNRLPCHKAGVKRLFFYGEVIDWLKRDRCSSSLDSASVVAKRRKTVSGSVASRHRGD